MAKLGFIGCGNMGGALAKAAAKAKCEILCSDFDNNKAEALARKVGGTVADNLQVVSECDYIFLGVKPQVMASVLAGVKQALASRGGRFVLVSMAAGITTEKICAMAGGTYPVIRIMPNTPVAVGGGMVLYTTLGTTDEETELFLSLMKAAGRFDALPEKLIDAASAVSGCGPAFVCQFLEALADGGVACGLPRDKALLYATATLEGTARLVAETGVHPAALKDAVCSPGGSTIEGVRRLEEGALRATVIDAVIDSYERTKELGK